MTDQIRTVALALCRDDAGRILVERGYDRIRDEHFFRGIGGGVEFGERAEAALRREWREELGLTLRRPALLAVLENIFTHEGRRGHEIVFVHSAEIVERWPYDQREFERIDPEGLTHAALWATAAELRTSERPCYPPGLLDLCAV
jgi:ADP-ribose pyrophosphatase YjhB (NUDIX family)